MVATHLLVMYSVTSVGTVLSNSEGVLNLSTHNFLYLIKFVFGFCLSIILQLKYYILVNQ